MIMCVQLSSNGLKKGRNMRVYCDGNLLSQRNFYTQLQLTVTYFIGKVIIQSTLKNAHILIQTRIF